VAVRVKFRKQPESAPARRKADCRYGRNFIHFHQRRFDVSEAVSFIAKEDLADLLDDRGVKLIDVRINWDSSREKIKHAVHEDPNEVAAWASKYDRNSTIVLYCSSPEQQVSCDAARALVQQGFADVRVLRGGWAVWSTAGLPVQQRTPFPTPEGFVKDVLKE
jgi:rhodanese-related sulfurtransferase